jgi:hypothetical protein
MERLCWTESLQSISKFNFCEKAGLIFTFTSDNPVQFYFDQKEFQSFAICQLRARAFYRHVLKIGRIGIRFL